MFPLSPNSKVPPKDFAWKAEASADPARVAEWAQQYPGCNWGLATGDGVIVLDADTKDGKLGLASLEAMKQRLGLPQSFRVETPSGGRHVYLRSDTAHQNSVDKLTDFPGIDVRSTNGYVVAPGSSLDGKVYRAVGTPTDIAELPADLDRVLLSVTRKRAAAKTDIPLVELDQELNVERARKYLTDRAPEAVEGAGGDETTFRVAAQCRDHGLSEGTVLELMLDWNDVKAFPPWSPEDLADKVSNAFQYATGGWGKDTALAEFGILDIDVGEPPARVAKLSKDQPSNRGKFYSISFADAVARALDEGAAPLIEGVLDQGTLAVIYGPSNSGKTFISADIAGAIAAGKDWNGNKVAQGAVLYIAAEGGGGIKKRLAALATKWRLPDALPLNLAPCSVDLFDAGAELSELVAECKKVAHDSGTDLRLVVVDTLARTMGAGDENSGKDMGAYVRNIDRLREATGSAVLIVHHTGKDHARGARGHSSLVAAVDTEMEVERRSDSTVGVLRNTKQRDLEKFGDISFVLESVTIGSDRNGKVVTSCVVRWLSEDEFGMVPLSGAEQRFLDSLKRLGRAATRQDWEDAHIRSLDAKWKPGHKLPTGCSEQNLRRLRRRLLDGGYVDEHDGVYYPIDVSQIELV